MPTTPILQLPYPSPNDVPDGPAQIQALAEAIEARAAFVVGEIRFMVVSATPAGWLLADGTLVSRSTYAKLFAQIGTNFGAGDGSTTFALPDVLGRALVGAGTGAGLTNRVVGTKWGVEAVVLSLAQIPSHNHGGSTGNASSPQPLLINTSESQANSGAGPYVGEGKTSFVHAHTITAQGGGASHDNTQPSLAVPAYIYAGA